LALPKQLLVTESLDDLELPTHMQNDTRSAAILQSPALENALFPSYVVVQYVQDAIKSVVHAKPSTEFSPEAIPFSEFSSETVHHDHVKRFRKEPEHSYIAPQRYKTTGMESVDHATTAPSAFAPRELGIPPPMSLPQAASLPLNGENSMFTTAGAASRQNLTNGQTMVAGPLDQSGSSALQHGVAPLVAPALSPNPLDTASAAASCMINTTNGTTPQFCFPVNLGFAFSPQAQNTNVKRCRIEGCNEPASSKQKKSLYCSQHSGNRLCEHPGCEKCAQGPTRFCIKHGGGNRCQRIGCDRGARDKKFCAAHGGGKRCADKDCTKAAVGGSPYCTNHGGGRRCTVPGCEKSAQGKQQLCVKHGGGRRCAKVGCEKVARGKTDFCAAHGGGVRCKLEGCNRVAVGKMQLCRNHGGGARQGR